MRGRTGSNTHAHEVDVIIQVETGRARGNGRFGVGGEVEVWEPGSVVIFLTEMIFWRGDFPNNNFRGYLLNETH